MSLRHSIKQDASLGKDWSGLLFERVFVVFPVVTQRHCRCELVACSVWGCCANSARPGVLDQSIWSNGSSKSRLKLSGAQESHPQEDHVITEADETFLH